MIDKIAASHPKEKHAFIVNKHTDVHNSTTIATQHMEQRRPTTIGFDSIFQEIVQDLISADTDQQSLEMNISMMSARQHPLLPDNPIIQYTGDNSVSVDFKRMIPGKPYAYIMRDRYMLTVRNIDDELITLRLPKRYRLSAEKRRIYE